MPSHFHLHQQRTYITELKTSITAYKISWDCYNESFLQTIETLKLELQTLRNHQPSPPLPITDSTTPIANFDQPPPFTDITMAAKDIRNDLVPSVADADLLLHDEVPISTNVEHKGLPRETEPEPPNRLKVPPPPLQSTDVPEHSFDKLVTTIARLIEPTELAVKIPGRSSPPSSPSRSQLLTPPPPSVFIFDPGGIRRFLHITSATPQSHPGFVFDPDGSPTDAIPSAVRCRLPDRRPPSSRHICSQSRRVSSSPFQSAVFPPSSVRARTSPAWSSSHTTAPPLGPASSWPWVPWRHRNQNNFRVSGALCLCELLKNHSPMGFTTYLCQNADWASSKGLIIVVFTLIDKRWTLREGKYLEVGP